MNREEFIEKTGITGIEIIWLDIVIAKAESAAAKDAYNSIEANIKKQ